MVNYTALAEEISTYRLQLSNMKSRLQVLNLTLGNTPQGGWSPESHLAERMRDMRNDIQKAITAMERHLLYICAKAEKQRKEVRHDAA